MNETIKKAIDAYGGEEFWLKANKISAIVSTRGLAFTLKRRPFFEKARIEMETERQFSKLKPIGKNPVISGILYGNAVRLEDGAGNILAQRENPRKFFPFGRRLFYWDDLDMAYFANYAFWNYFTLPRLMLDDSIKWTETSQGKLIAVFPDDIHTHSPNQEFIFDTQTGLLKQHNYTAEVISKLATAAHVIHQHKTQNGLNFPSRRIVTPKSRSGKALKYPVLIDIEVDEFEVE